MALEASDRLIDVNWRCTCICISRSTFRLSASLLYIVGKSKEISQDLRKKVVDLHKSGSSFGAFSKRLKVPHSSGQTKYASINTFLRQMLYILLLLPSLMTEKSLWASEPPLPSVLLANKQSLENKLYNL